MFSAMLEAIGCLFWLVVLIVIIILVLTFIVFSSTKNGDSDSGSMRHSRVVVVT